MYKAGDPELVRQEVEQLRALQSQGGWKKLKWYFSKSGPGWMQSAMTLGGGSAIASLYSGAYLGYQMLWVQPVAILLGIVMLYALAYQTLSTGERPFRAMCTYVGKPVAWGWAICTILATVVWHFSQYSLITGMTLDMLETVGGFRIASGSPLQTVILLGLAFVVFALACKVVWSYGKGGKGVRLIERIIKGIIWFIIFAFALVVIVCSVNGAIDWRAVGRGFVPFSFDGGFHFNVPEGHQGFSIFVASLSAAVGINMTFLYGYSFLAKGWTKEYKGLAKFDLVTGMLIPYTVATSLMIIAAGSTLHTEEFLSSGATSISPIAAASMLEAAGLPHVVSRLIFGLGIVGMCFNAITMHMVVCGFAATELFGIPAEGWKYRLCTLIPSVGVLGAIFWSSIGTWIVIPTSALTLIVLPVAYLGFFLLNNSSKYLKEDMPRGRKRFWWNLAMSVTIVVTIVCAVYYLVSHFSC